MSEDEQQKPVRVREVSEDVIAVELPGGTVLTDAVCPHRKGRLRFGYVDADRMRITCPLHHSTFSLENGRRLAGPVCDALRIHEQGTPG
ncbi:MULTISPECIES: Rieske (2Fe-2S) protein [unclassified Streptomyces]|uniref:Rieske (2Fe-2S) protein n=1 Tax=unclassified Streptomyces TaxID=2593676 RepID=UPI0009400443|nr:Rieske (2Fe-2S) protein [Streptomyces sp. CB02058]OKI94024.1 hypothetical protein AMK10_16860 [Streptomyces sp. CB02058]